MDFDRLFLVDVDVPCTGDPILAFVQAVKRGRFIRPSRTAHIQHREPKFLPGPSVFSSVHFNYNLLQFIQPTPTIFELVLSSCAWQKLLLDSPRLCLWPHEMLGYFVPVFLRYPLRDTSRLNRVEPLFDWEVLLRVPREERTICPFSVDRLKVEELNFEGVQHNGVLWYSGA